MAKRKFRLSKKYFLFLIPLFLLGLFLVQSYFDSRVVIGCRTQDYLGVYDKEETLAYLGSETVNVLGEEALGVPPVLGVANPSSRWIEIDLSEQKLKAWDGDSLFLETPIASGLPWWPTPQGEFRIWIKLRYTKMEGGSGRYYYYLPNVPYVMFFENDSVPGWKGYGLHGTYWHNSFGTPRSHGCVNLPTDIAEKLFYWTTPTVPQGKWVVWSSNGNPGTRIVIHE